MSYENIRVETRGKVGLITLHRPDALNALNAALMEELGKAVDTFENNADIGAIVITGSEKAFAAGADIKEMQDKSFVDVYAGDFITASWERIAACRKPIVAAVAGYALGGGCEVAMMCDFILTRPSSASRKFALESFRVRAARNALRVLLASRRRWRWC